MTVIPGSKRTLICITVIGVVILLVYLSSKKDMDPEERELYDFLDWIDTED